VLPWLISWTAIERDELRAAFEQHEAMRGKPPEPALCEVCPEEMVERLGIENARLLEECDEALARAEKAEAENARLRERLTLA